MMMDGWMAGWMLLWLLVGVGLLVVLALGAVWLVRAVSGRDERGEPSTARRELDVRYAQGELSHEDYVERRRQLSG